MGRGYFSIALLYSIGEMVVLSFFLSTTKKKKVDFSSISSTEKEGRCPKYDAFKSLVERKASAPQLLTQALHQSNGLPLLGIESDEVRNLPVLRQRIKDFIIDQFNKRLVVNHKKPSAIFLHLDLFR